MCFGMVLIMSVYNIALQGFSTFTVGSALLLFAVTFIVAFIAESFVDASEQSKVAEQLVVVVRPEDASRFKVNLYDVKDHLEQTLHS